MDGFTSFTIHCMVVGSTVLCCVIGLVAPREDVGLPPIKKWKRAGFTLYLTRSIANGANKIQSGAFLSVSTLITGIEICAPISKIEDSAFDGLERIRKLSLQGKLNHLSSNIFVHLKELVHLEFNGNQISIVKSGVFKHRI